MELQKLYVLVPRDTIREFDNLAREQRRSRNKALQVLIENALATRQQQPRGKRSRTEARGETA
jgi:hypothetical protein